VKRSRRPPIFSLRRREAMIIPRPLYRVPGVPTVENVLDERIRAPRKKIERKKKNPSRISPSPRTTSSGTRVGAVKGPKRVMSHSPQIWNNKIIHFEWMIIIIYSPWFLDGAVTSDGCRRRLIWGSKKFRTGRRWRGWGRGGFSFTGFQKLFSQNYAEKTPAELRRKTGTKRVLNSMAVSYTLMLWKSNDVYENVRYNSYHARGMVCIVL